MIVLLCFPFSRSRRMGDHLALLVDHLLTESTLEAAIGSRKQGQIATDSATLEDPGKEFTRKRSVRDRYAHRKCVQRWCNEKGDTVCEICLKEFKPDYTAPPKLFHYGSIPMNFRGNWEITREDFNDSRIITLFPSERDTMRSSYDDLSALSTRSTVCCQTVAITFMLLLLLRHLLPLVISGTEQHPFAPISILLLRTAGISLPVFLMIRTIRTFRHQQRT
ncbi:hypothetical protein C4D60_Mb08t17840 [Musa balbisiana]|uniref:RING-CH-type domain-containing protein n=1 Tax=Musa balbisiana TaxID=52838 RepID=A0A4S8K4M2_MUSBA|nr:hypothetical protein C4D60_Mb08t17840 [Musa balbisiana]